MINMLNNFNTFQETDEYFRRRFNRCLTKHDRLEFLNLWYVLIIVNDVLLVAGSVIKELMESQVIITIFSW